MAALHLEIKAFRLAVTLAASLRLGAVKAVQLAGGQRW